MNEFDYLLDILKYSIAGLIVIFTAWFFIKDFIAQKWNYQNFQLRKAGLDHTLPLRLQAYERTVLFLERINPSSLLIRLHVSGMTAREMQNIILSDIRAEYQHNISQQIYVSDTTWTVVRKIKDDTIIMVNNVVAALPESATSLDLSRSILTHLAEMDTDNPYEVALSIVKKDVQSIF